MLKLKLQYFDHLIRRTDSLEKTLMLGKIEDRRRRGQQRMRNYLLQSDMVLRHFPGEAIKLLFSTSSKILSLRINTGLGTEA